MTPRSCTWLILSAVVGLGHPALAQHGSPEAHQPATSTPMPAAPAGPVSTDREHADAKVAPQSTAAKSDPARSRSKTASTASARAKSAESKLGDAMARIQERITAETGPNAAKPATRPTAAAATAQASPAARARTSATRPVVLNWRASLQWPAELEPTVHLVPPSPVELIWR